MTTTAAKRGRCPVCASALPRHAASCWIPGSEVQLGNCYEDCLRFLLRAPAPAQAEFSLVHGEPTLTVAPFIPFGHAWLELGPLVLDVTAKATVLRDVYYQTGKIDPSKCTKYTLSEAQRMMREHGTFGPW